MSEEGVSGWRLGASGLHVVQVQIARASLGLLDREGRGWCTPRTMMNKHSSRSHCVLQLKVNRVPRPDNTTVMPQLNSSGYRQTLELLQHQGLLTVVDMAGSERVKKTLSEGDTFLGGDKHKYEPACLDSIDASARREVMFRIETPCSENTPSRPCQEEAGLHCSSALRRSWNTPMRRRLPRVCFPSYASNDSSSGSLCKC